MRKKKCVICQNEFLPERNFQKWCSIDHAIDYANQLKQKNLRKQYREAKEHAKTRQDWIKEAQTAFNAYIRARDAVLPCISCGRFHQGQYHAGHYRTTAAAPELRFNELNVWKQCAPCNNHKHGNITEYRINLVKRIGLDKVEWLEGQHEPKKYTIEELKQIKDTYKRKLREIQND